MSEDNGKDKQRRSETIKSITAPLGFFVLALLIVEAFLGVVLVGADLDNDLKRLCVVAGISLFVLVVSLVFLLVWFKPQSLMFDKDAYLSTKH